METATARSIDFKEWREFDGKIPSDNQWEEQERYHRYFDTSPIPFVLIGSEGIVYINHALQICSPTKTRAFLDALMEPVHKNKEGKLINTFDLAKSTSMTPSVNNRYDFGIAGSNYQLRISQIKGLTQERYTRVAVVDVTKDKRIAALEAEIQQLISMGETQLSEIETLKENWTRKARETNLINEIRGIFNHDAKTPLTSVKGYAQLLQRLVSRMPEAQQDERIINGLKVIDNKASAANRKLCEAVAISNEPKLEKIDAEKFLKTVVAENDSLINPDNKEVKIAVKFSLDASSFLTDKAWTLCIINTLILNACDAGATEISLRYEKVLGRCVLYVKDNGSGMDSEIRDKLNSDVDERFESKKGNGIGVKNARNLLKILGGRMWIPWSIIGEGTIFALSFPLVDN